MSDTSHPRHAHTHHREQGALEQAALAAQRQAHDLRSRLAEAQAGWQRAQAAADGAQQERTHLLQQFAQELNKASLVEQVGAAVSRVVWWPLGRWDVSLVCVCVVWCWWGVPTSTQR